MDPEKVVRLLLASNESSIAERFVLASPKNSFCIAALLGSIANNLQELPLKLDMSFSGGDFTEFQPKSLISKLTVDAKDLRPRLLKCLCRALITSISRSPNITAHLKAIATVFYTQSDFANCTRVLLDIIRIASKENFLSNPVLTDPTYYEMLISSLSENRRILQCCSSLPNRCVFRSGQRIPDVDDPSSLVPNRNVHVYSISGIGWSAGLRFW